MSSVEHFHASFVLCFVVFSFVEGENGEPWLCLRACICFSFCRISLGDFLLMFSFLKEKKKKSKGIVPEADREPSLNQYDKVEFGDIVQAPPKLSFPRKAEAVSVLCLL